MNMQSKYDTMHRNRMFHAFIWINNNVNIKISCTLSGITINYTSPSFFFVINGYYVAYKPIRLSCILFMFIKMKFIHCHSCVMFAMKSLSICND